MDPRTVEVVGVERNGEELLSVVWHLEHPNYDHEEELETEVVEEMLGSHYRLA